MKFIDAIKSRKNVDPAVQALETKYRDLNEILDPGERLLGYSKIREDIQNKINEKFRALVVPVMAATIAAVVITLIPPLLMPSIIVAAPFLAFSAVGVMAVATFSAPIWAEQNFQKDATVKGAYELLNRTDAEIKELSTSNVISFYNSNKFEEVMTKFPDIKESFLMAAVKIWASREPHQTQDSKFNILSVGATGESPSGSNKKLNF